jgi:polyketide synthase PksL
VLQVGRESMEERLGFVVSSVEQVAEKLEAYVAGEQGIEDVYQGQVKRNHEALSLFSSDVDLQQTIDKWIVNKKLFKLLELWVKGLEVDWSKLYGEVKPQRMSLPTYPFAKERYWIDTAAGGEVAAQGAAIAVLHPLLHSNTSDLSEQRYASVFKGDEFFLADSRAPDGTVLKILPAVAYLEMARAAIDLALPVRTQSAILELRNTRWTQPIAFAENKQIHLALLADGDDQIGYEIYSKHSEQETVHCQGRALFSHQAAPADLDIAHLKARMRLGQVEPNIIYASCARMGLAHGPAFQAVVAIHKGSNELLAHLRLPGGLSGNDGDYVLHPSLMESALQAGVGLLDEDVAGGSPGLLSGEPLTSGTERALAPGSFASLVPPQNSSRPRLLFALESLRILSSCTQEMFAWVRYSPDGQSRSVLKLDIDLCEPRGNIAVQMRGVEWRQPLLDQVVQSTPPAALAIQTKATTTPSLAKEIAFTACSPVLIRVSGEKPAGISLAAPGRLISE